MEKSSTPYRRAKTWHVALSQMTGITQMCFYVLLGYASYIGNLGFAITAVVVGVLITISRVFDGITDPIIAVVIERFKSKHGKIRFFLIVGWALMALATTLMCNFIGGASWFHLDEFKAAGENANSSALGIAIFLLLYFVYIVGYTFSSCASNVTGNILTNDPKQRPILAVWSTVYSYLAPTLVAALITVVLLPKFGISVIKTDGTTDYQWTLEVMKWANIIVLVVSFIALILTCIGIAPYDKMENYASLNKKSNPSFKEMGQLLKGNKELRRYIVAAASDKLASTMNSQAYISTLLFGVLLGGMVSSYIVSIIAMLPSIIFAIIGAKMAGKKGNKKILVQWTWICIVWNLIFTLFILFVPAGGSKVNGIWVMILFFLLMLGNNAVKMVVSGASSSMRMDVVDYELYRSGNYLPATVSAVYSFLDKLISAFAPMLVTLLLMTIGYIGSIVPQATDELTWNIRILLAIIYCGFPILGWICTIFAMKNCSLTKERMEEIQKVIAEKKALAVIEEEKAQGWVAEEKVDAKTETKEKLSETIKEVEKDDKE